MKLETTFHNGLLNMAKPQGGASEGMWFIHEMLENVVKNKPYKYDLSGEPKTPKRSWGPKRLRRYRNAEARISAFLKKVGLS